VELKIPPPPYSEAKALSEDEALAKAIHLAETGGEESLSDDSDDEGNDVVRISPKRKRKAEPPAVEKPLTLGKRLKQAREDLLRKKLLEIVKRIVDRLETHLNNNTLGISKALDISFDVLPPDSKALLENEANFSFLRSECKAIDLIVTRTIPDIWHISRTEKATGLRVQWSDQ
jgi:hypothetical protein